MKTRINLYRDEFKPQFVWLTVANMLLLSVVVLLVLSGIYYSVWKTMDSRANELSKLRTTIQQRQATLDELTISLTQRKKDPVLLNKLEMRLTLLASLQQLATKLDSLNSMQKTPFSVAFDSFSNADSSDVWLSAFKINESSVRIEGSISYPEALPTWLQAVAKTTYFQHTSFRTANVKREQGQLRFVIENAESNKDAEYE
jgi:Tfp pilus assembly protein PilN